MSTIIMSKCWPLPMSPTQKAVLISLADQANDHGVCWPSIDTISARTCLGRRAVINAIADLESLGHLTPKKTVGQVTHYQLHPCTTCTSADGAPVHDVHPTRAPRALDPCTTCTTPVHDVHPNRKEPTRTVIEPSKRASKSPASDSVDIPDWIPGEAWARWVSHRRAIKAPMTADAAALTIRQLDKFRRAGDPPVAVIDQSILNGWRGLFALRHATGAGNGYANGGGSRRESEAHRVERLNREHDEREDRRNERARADFRSDDAAILGAHGVDIPVEVVQRHG